jgi:hypothetical protein
VRRGPRLDVAHARNIAPLGYAVWDFVSSSRTEQTRNHLWHSANPVEAYAGLARNLGLSLGIEDFRAGTHT